MSVFALTSDEPMWDLWWEHANCRTMDPDIFFPVEPDRVPVAAQIACDSCPVREPCHQHALHHELYGVWAGTSEHGRKRLRRTLRIRVDRPEVPDPPREQVCSMHDRGLMPHEIAKEIGVTRRTVHRYLTQTGEA